MTNNEIISSLRGLIGKYNLTDEEWQTVEKTIKILNNSDEDCISRAELLKAVDTWDKFGCDADTKLVPVKDCYVPYIHYDDVVKAIKGMPSIQPKPKTEWIPVSERLPELHNYMQEYLVTIKGKFIRTAFFTETNGKSWWSIDNVIAWMPLPYPYKAESRE